MECLIRNGLEEVAGLSERLNEKPRTLYIGYDADTETISGSFKQDGATGKIVAFVRRAVDTETLSKIVSAGYAATSIEESLEIPKNQSEYASEDLKQFCRDNGFDDKYYSDIVMGAYLWKVYTSHHRDADDGKSARMYLSFSGNCYCKDNPKAALWFYDTHVRGGDAYIGNTLPAAYADCSIYTIAAAMIRVFNAKKDALFAIKDYARNGGSTT